MNPYYLGMTIGPELLKREFKELCLSYIQMFFSEEEAKQMLYNDIPLNPTRFNEMIYYTLDQYIQKYVPKYIGNFSKAEISGDLYIGVDDSGLIEGIPFNGKLDNLVIKKMFIDAMSNSRGIRINADGSLTNDPSVIDFYYENMKIHVYDLHKHESKSLDFVKNRMHQKSKLTRLNEFNETIAKMWESYNVVYAEWLAKLNKYAGKLLNYLTDDSMRIEVIKYVIDDFKANSIYDQSKLIEIIDFFLQDKENFKKILFDIDNIGEIIKNPYSPIKWLISYKDKTLADIKKSKPICPVLKSDSTNHLRFCKSIKNISTNLMSTSDDIKFYLIKITIPTIHNTYLEYRSGNSSPWISRKRILTKDGPSCS
jgi:hypothetical protein